MLAKVREVLANSSYDDVKVRAIRNLAHFKDKESVPLLIKELDKPGVVRAQAATALAAIGLPAAEPAKPALLSALPSTDEKDRPQVVWALAVLKESTRNREVFREGDLVLWAADGPDGVRYAAAFNLGDSPAEVALDAGNIGFPASGAVTELWTGAAVPLEPVAVQSDTARGVAPGSAALRIDLAPHGAALLRWHG